MTAYVTNEMWRFKAARQNNDFSIMHTHCKAVATATIHTQTN